MMRSKSVLIFTKEQLASHWLRWQKDLHHWMCRSTKRRIHPSCVNYKHTMALFAWLFSIESMAFVSLFTLTCGAQTCAALWCNSHCLSFRAWSNSSTSLFLFLSSSWLHFSECLISSRSWSLSVTSDLAFCNCLSISANWPVICRSSPYKFQNVCLIFISIAGINFVSHSNKSRPCYPEHEIHQHDVTFSRLATQVLLFRITKNTNKCAMYLLLFGLWFQRGNLLFLLLYISIHLTQVVFQFFNCKGLMTFCRPFMVSCVVHSIDSLYLDWLTFLSVSNYYNTGSL